MIKTRTIPLFLLALLAACGSDDATGPGQSDLLGTWSLVSIDGQSVPAGTVTWTVTEATLVVTQPGCTETGSYTLSGETLRSTTSDVSGSACASSVGDQFDIRVSISGSSLTVTFSDPVTVLVFTRQ